MNNKLKYLIVLIWIVNGLFCKVLKLVPRHEKIVSRVLGSDYSETLTILIGFSEILMAIWILSNYKSKLNTVTQITIVLIMNIIEFIIAPDLLLWGKFNLLFAILFCLMIYYNEFNFNKKNAIV